MAMRSMFLVVGVLLCSWGCGGAAYAQSGDGARRKPTGPVVSAQGAPEPDPSKEGPVSLREMLAWAGRHAPDVVVAKRRRALGDAAEAGARPLFPANPEAAVSVGPRSRGDTSGIDVEGSLVQRFEIAGERRRRLRVAERTKDRLQAELDVARWDVHRRVHAAFHDALVTRERTEAQRELRDFQNKLLEYARKRLAAGDIAELDVRIVEAEAAEAQQRLVRAKQRYRAARLRLAEVAGWPAGDPPVPAGELPEARRTPPLEQLMRRARRHNPALHRQAHAVQEARARAEVAERDAWPEPAIGIAAGREDPGGGQGATVVRGIVELPLPLWRRNQGERAKTRAELDIARTEDRAMRSVLRRRIARAANAVDAAAERVEVYSQKVLPQFEANLGKLRRAYELGEIDMLDISVARQRFLRIQRQALDVYGAYFDSIARLEAQLGTEVWSERAQRP